MSQITAETSVADVLRDRPNAREVFDRHGLRGCGGEHGPSEPLSFFASVHQVDVDELLQELNSGVSSATTSYTCEERPEDVIYRRFFKAAIVTVLSVGALWGAISLLRIAAGGSFLQISLLPAIHAHAQAMMSGWLGLFVMGFAYQSFPRFKNTTLWRPDLANLTFYFIIIGFCSRIVAELTAPSAPSLFFGVLGFGLEMIAGLVFVIVLMKTARKSLEPWARHERFILGSLFWFLLQIPLSYLLFFAKVLAHTQEQAVMRIALIDGPLRDIQLLGFAALIIAGVSQRFIPVVYGLKAPSRDRLKLIFWLINGGLVMIVASYVLLLTSFKPGFAIDLELGYLTMPVWAILLAKQIGVFRAPQRPDRTFKFIRAAYIWLLVSSFMLPLFPIYSVLTGQFFAHSWMGAFRHAFTVGFISMMILGISSRVVPILSGVDGAKMTTLKAPFVLLNLGCGGRVLLQVLTDWSPNFAYPLLGLTGFLEVTALAWWGVHLWRVMILARTHRRSALTINVPLEAVR